MKTVIAILNKIAFPIMLLLASACSKPPTHNLHEQLRQHLLEAELGSAISIHFAKKPVIPLPPNETQTQLLHQLQSNNVETRWSAADKLAYSSNKDATLALIDAMLDSEGTQRVCVMAKALGHLKDPRALGALTQAAFDPYNRDLRLCAIRSIGMLGDKRAVPDLIRSLKQGNNPIQSANSLARLGDARAVDALITAANDINIRPWMVTALGELGNNKALPYLKTLTMDTDNTVSNIISEAIWKITTLNDEQTKYPLENVMLHDSFDQHRMWAAFRMGEHRQPQYIKPLILALADSSIAVRGRVMASIVRYRQLATPQLRKALHSPNKMIQHHAIAIIAYIGTADDIALLEKIKTNQAIINATMDESISLLRKHVSIDKNITSHT